MAVTFFFKKWGGVFFLKGQKQLEGFNHEKIKIAAFLNSPKQCCKNEFGLPAKFLLQGHTPATPTPILQQKQVSWPSSCLLKSKQH